MAAWLEAVFAALLLPRFQSLNGTLLLLAGAGIFYLIAVALTLRRAAHAPELKLRWIVLAALAFRLTLLTLTPQLTHELWRYRWDGEIQAAGFNPYVYPPDHVVFQPIRRAADELVPGQAAAAFHPPLAERIFHWNFSLASTLRLEKILYVGADVVLILLLARILAARGRPREWALIYAWSPLAVFEVAGNGHMAPIAGLLLLLALHWAGRRTRWSGFLASAAGLTQWYALALAPVVLGAARRRWAGAVGWGVALGAAATVPYWFLNRSFVLGKVVANGWHHLASTPEFNASIFALAQRWFPAGVAWGIAIGLVAALVAIHVWKRSDPLRAGFGILAAMILVMPQVEPWHLLWLLPFAAIFPEMPWLYFSVAVVLGYAAGEHPGAIWIEYVPLYAGIMWAAWRGRQGTGPAIEVARA